MTGDPPAIGDYPDATGVFDVDSIGLTNVVASLNRGLDIGGQPIGQPTAFHIGVAANPGALNLDEEVRRFRYKVEAGAEFAITQPVFDVDELGRFLDADRGRADSGARRRHAAREPAARRVHGQRSAGRERAGGRARADAPGDAARPRAAEGVAIAREIVAGIRPLVQGLQITTAGGAIDAALGVIEAVEA